MNTPENTRNDLANALERINVHNHLCLIYESLEEQLAAVIPFFKKGLKSNEQCVYIVDDNTAQTVLDAMRSEGIDVDSAIGSGSLMVITKREAYLKEGYFDPDLMIQFLKEAVDSAKKAGFAALRATGEMTWALGSDPGDERLIEYEAKLNYFIPKNDILAICQYNRKRFSPEIIIDVIRTHPTVIYGSLVCENFYYVPPDEFLGPKNTKISMEVERLLKNIQDYERAEKKLREGSLYTRSLIEASLDPLVTISLYGKITDVNKATELVTGVSREELIGKDFSDYFTTPEKARKGYQEVFEKGFVRDYPLAIRHISGNITEVLYNATVYKNESGEVQGVFAAARDITKRKRAEEQLRIASLYSRNLIETSLDPLVTISPQGKIMDVNNATELVTGIPREELIGSDFSNYFTEPEKARKGYHEVFEKGFVRDYPLAIRHISGRITDVLYNASVYRDPSGNIAGVFAAARDITERNKAQEARSMLASIVEFSEDGIIGKTMDGIIVSWNPGAEKLYGFSENEVVGKPISILIPPGHFDEMPAILEKIKMGERIEHFEAARIRKDGKRIDVSLTISPIKDAQGRIIGASTIARDITEHKKIEKQLRDASLYVRNLIEASLDPLVTISPEGKITDVNKGTELATGIPREELIGSDFSNYFTTPETARKGYHEVFEKGFVRDYPLAIRHKSGKITDVLYNAAVYKDETGHVQGVFAAARDITQRKRAEEQLRIASLYARNLIEASLDPLVTINSAGKITDVNNATELVTGVSREKLIGSDFSDYFTTPEEARKGYEEVFEKGFVRDYPLAIRHKSGNVTDVLYNAVVYKNEAGEVQGVFAAARDITERKNAEKELRRIRDGLEIMVRERTSELMKSLAEKEVLIKEVHHRVKNNLQIISSMFELQSTYMKDKQAIMAFREGQNRVSTMALIHEKLYRSGDLSRIRFSEYIEELTTNIFVSYGVNSNQIRLNLNAGEFFFDVNTAIPCGLIINELVSNSIKHAFPDGRKGEINIKLRHENGENYLLEINDNGRGFPPDLDFRNSETLGLKLVITLAKQINGTIELDRTAGTRFIIIFSELKYKDR